MYTIQDLADGKCAVKNDGTLEELKKVLKLAFPLDPDIISGLNTYYFKHAWSSTQWSASVNTNLPTQSVKEFLKQKTENMRTITHDQASQIIDIACSSWKEKLAFLWAKNIVLKKDIEISEDFYKEMRKACTLPQNELFDEIFGKDYKEGDWVYVITGGNGALGADEFIGQVCNKEKAKSVEYHGQDSHEYAPLYVIRNNTSWGLCEGFKVRPATPEEIQQAQCPYYDGQLVAVSDNKVTWELVYATGKSNQHGRTFYAKGTKGNGSAYTWKYHKPLPEGFTLD